MGLTLLTGEPLMCVVIFSGEKDKIEFKFKIHSDNIDFKQKKLCSILFLKQKKITVMSSNKLEMCSLSLFTILTLIFQPFLDIRTQQKLQPLAFIIAVLEGKKCSLSSYILLEFPSPSSIRTTLDILFSSNHNIHKSLSGRSFWASDPLIDRF